MSGEGASSRDGDEGSSRVGTTSTAEDVEPEDEAQQQPQRQKAPLGKASKGARAARTQKAAAASVRPVASPLSPQQVQEGVACGGTSRVGCSSVEAMPFCQAVVPSGRVRRGRREGRVMPVASAPFRENNEIILGATDMDIDRCSRLA